MCTRRFSQRRLFAWLSSALLIVATTAGPGGERIVHARAEQQTIGGPEQTSDGTSQFILRASPANIEAIAARHGLTVIARVGQSDVFLVSRPPQTISDFGVMSISSPDAVTSSIQQDPEVADFEVNAIVATPEVAPGVYLNHSTAEILDSLNNRTMVEYFGPLAWHGYVNQPAAGAVRLADTHAASKTGASVVAIIDTGVDPNHPLLQGVLVPGYDFVSDTAGSASEWTDLDHSTAEILDHSTAEILDSTVAPVPLNPSTVAVLDSDSTLDPSQLPPAFGHGTMVAGIVHLVAPTARIMPLKAFRADGTSRTFDIVRAIYYAVDHGARVINLSFSATTPSGEIARAINYATDRGVICVASVGNLGREVVVYPGGFRNVIGVASTNAAMPPVRSVFSNYGDSVVSLAAPGEGIITTYPGGGYAAAWGTSFSTPIVAGGAALMLQIDPTLNFQKANDQFAKAIAMAPGLGMGWGRLNLYEAARTLPDAIAPSASMLTPASTGFISGDVLVSASASDNVAVVGVKFLLDGSPLGVEDTTAPYELSWPTTATANGAHVVTAIARDAAGNVASSNTSVMVSNDFEPPTIALTAPAPGIFVNGTVTVAASAADDIGVAGVQFKLDGALVGAEDVDPPYELSWNTEPVSDGPHTWTVVARDAAGKEASSTIIVKVTHDVTAPTVAVIAPAAEATVSGTITITAAAADDVSVARVQFLLDGMPHGAPVTSAPYEASWSTLSVGNGTHTLTAVARDDVGHFTTAGAVSFTVLNDLASPTVGLVTPAAGAIVDGIVTVSATAADDVGVTSVQFLLDGAPLGDPVSAAPYQVAWPTTGATNGAHMVSAVARDAAGREATAAVAIVNVRNDLAPPTVVLSTPTAGATVSGSIIAVATAVDDVGVTSVQFLLDGAPLGEADAEAPYQVSWSTLSVANGAHALTAVARDGAGRETTAEATTIMVLNDLTAPTVALASHAPGATVHGIVTLSATAVDDVAVSSVQFLIDGAPLGDADLEPPYEVAWPTLAVANGPHALSAVARDGAGRETTAEAVSVSVLNDLVAPTVVLASPAAGSTVQAAVTVTATAGDDIGVSSVQFLVDGASLGAPDSEAPYEVTWPTLAVTNGAHALTAVARDAAGRETTAEAVTVMVLNDVAAPTVALTSPAAGTTIGGTVTVVATAADDIGVTSLQFLLDGATLGAPDSEPPYEATWPTAAVANGAHALTAVARDAAGRETTSEAATVTVLNDAAAPTVALTSPGADTTIGGTVTVAATAADDIGVTSVQFMVDGAPLGVPDTDAPYEAEWITSTTANGAHTISAVARDAVGHVTLSGSVALTVVNDLAPPTVGFVTPAAGATVDGIVTVSATAADDVGVTSVQFLLDGAPLGALVSAAPYQVEWPTTAATNAAHTLTAVARDAAGRETTATAVIVNVRNDLAAPTVLLASPSAGATVQGAITVLATAVDDIGVTSVQFLLDGAPLGAADTEAPYEFAWPTLAVANGTHALTATARDGAGRETTADVTTVTVLNDLAAPTVALASPAAGATVHGSVTLAATAADDVGVSSVQFLLDGAPLGDADLEPPYEVTWPTLAVANGPHVLTALARDGAGRETTAEAVSISVLNDLAPPTVALASPTAGSTVQGAVTVTATAGDDIGVSSVQFLLNGASLGAPDSEPPYEVAWPTPTAANAAYALTAVARDAAGRETTAETVSVTVLNDLTAPTVVLATPVAGATVDGAIIVSATANDDVGVTSVQFLLDGSPLGDPVTAAPYQVEWPTTSVTNAAHTLTAVAHDGAGRETTASAVIVNVRNDLAAPTVVLASPSAGATLTGTIAIAATAVDDIGVTSVQFLLDGAPLGAAVSSAPYQVEWPTISATNAAHILTVVARDAAGRETTSDAVSVTVLNDLAAPTVALASPASGTTVQGIVTLTANAVDDIGVTSVQFLVDGVPLGAAVIAAPYQVEWPTTSATNTAHTVTAVARDAAGRETTSDAVSVTVLNDLAAPTVALTSPAADTTIGGTVTVAATAADDIGVTSVQFLVDGAPLAAADTDAPYQAEWVTSTAANGAHTISAVARDAAGHVTTASTVSVSVVNDATAPSIGLVTPVTGATVEGAIIVSATASDDVGVTSVQFLLDGAPFGAAVSAAPYQVEWPTTSATNAAHTLTAVARDAAGRETTATAVIVNVRNDLAAPTVVLASPSAGATVSGTIAIAATAIDDIGVTTVQFLLDGTPMGEVDTDAPYELAWTTLAAANGAHALTAVARDAAGRETTSEAVGVTVLNDAAAPTVTLTSPAPDTTIGGTVTVTATAADDIGVTSVQFLLDGAPLGAAVSAAPYQAEWPTTSATNAAHTLTAVARDAAGRETTATAVVVNVRNDLTAPTVTLTSPAPDTTIGGTVTVAATAADDIGVTSVQFLLDGAPLGAAVSAAPYQAEWPTTSATNAAHTLTAVARDAAGRETTATAVVVNVRNDLTAPTVTLTSPAADTTIEGTVTVAATAADDIGVTSVQFLLDGAPLGAAVSAAPYQVEWPTTSATNAAHTLTAVARDAAGRETTATAVVVNVRNDLAAPTVAVTSPAPDTTIGGTVTVAATAADDIGVTSVQFLLDGAPLGVADTDAPYEAEWVTSTAINGSHTLSAVARDAAGHVTSASTVGVTVVNDVTAPSIGLVTPSAGATVDGAIIVSATASDDVGVTSVQFLLDGAPLGAAVTAAPYQVEWPTTNVSNAAHILTAVAHDGAGRETTAAAVIVNVRNDLAAPTVTLASPASGATVNGVVTLTATAVDDIGVTSVQFLLNGAPLGAAVSTTPYQVEWPTSSATNGTHALTAVARDAAGRETTSDAVSVTVLNDAAAPTVAVTSPASEATVNGIVTLTATAADDVGVTSVQFLLDGAPLGAAITAAPYQVEWPTTNATNAAHTLTAVARDASGRETTSDAVGVTVLNDLAAPTVALTSPAADSTIGGTVTVAATAADDIGVTSVEFLLDGAPLGVADTDAPYEAEWLTSTTVNGAHTLTAVARDAAGHVTTASTVGVTVTNDVTAPSIGLVTPSAGATVEGAIIVSATASDDVGVTSVQFLLDGAPLGDAVSVAPYQVEWPTTSATNAAHTLTAVARDAAGRETTATAVIVNVRNDLAAPTVLLASPSAGATVNGAITVTATAVDDIGVTSVQFLLDGAPFGEVDTEFPYQVAWSTLTATNGTHTLAAVARDGAGRETTAEPVSVTVLNDVAAPTVTITNPTAETTVGGTLAIAATAADDVGVASVQFLIDGAPLGAADGEAPYEVEWATTASANGPHTITAVARDAAGRETTASVSVIVTNEPQH